MRIVTLPSGIVTVEVETPEEMDARHERQRAALREKLRASQLARKAKHRTIQCKDCGHRYPADSTRCSECDDEEEYRRQLARKDPPKYERRGPEDKSPIDGGSRAGSRHAERAAEAGEALRVLLGGDPYDLIDKLYGYKLYG